MISHIVRKWTKPVREKDSKDATEEPSRPLSIHLLYSTRLPQTDSSLASSAESVNSSTANETLSQILFLPRLRQLVDKVSSQPLPTRNVNLSVNLFLTNASPSTSDLKSDLQVGIHFRRITADDLRIVLRSQELNQICYICGPPPMTDAFVNIAEGIIGSDRVFCEKWW